MQGNGLKLEVGREKIDALFLMVSEQYGLLFLPALLSNRKEIAPLAEELGKFYTVLLFDYRGHGASDGRRGHATEARILGDIRCAMDYLASHVSHIGIIGYSTGGAFALKYATLDPWVELVVAISPVVSLKIRLLQRRNCLAYFREGKSRQSC